MNGDGRPRLRYFENSPGQRHIGAEDRYLYAETAARRRLGIIGTGTIGQEHMRVAALLGRTQVHGVFDPAAASVAAALEGFRRYADYQPRRYASLDEAIGDPDTEALFICTPNHTHVALVEAAAHSGKALFVEKPMATSVADAKRIAEIAAGYARFIQVGLQYRYKAPYVEARHEVLNRRSLGEVRMLTMSEYRPPFLDKVGQWNKFARYSGGTLIEKCCHYFDLLNLFAGARPTRVFASGGQTVNFKDFEYRGRRADIDDHAFVIVEYAGGVRASFTLNMFAPHFHEELVVAGERGRLLASERFDFHRDEVARSRLVVETGETGATRTTSLAYADAIDKSGHHGATFFEHRAFADRLDGLATDAATPLQGLWSILVAAAAEASRASGAPIDIGEFVTAHELTDLIDPGEQTPP